MQVKIILNRIEKHPSFVYEAVGLVDGPRLRLEVKVRTRATYTRQRGHHCARVPRTHGSLDIRRPGSTEPRRVRDPFRSVKSPSPPPVVVAALAAWG